MTNRARVIAPLAAAVLAVGGSVAATGTPAGTSPGTAPARPKVPGDVLDLSAWRLQLPVDAGGRAAPGCRIAQVQQPGLNTYGSPWFRTAAGGGVALRANVEGCRTSRSVGARSELVEMTGNRHAQWPASAGTHVMTLRAAVSRLPRAKARLVAAQVSDRSTAAFVITADASRGRRPGTVGLCYERNGRLLGCLDRSYVLGKPYDLTIAVSGGRIRVDYNGSRKVDLPHTARANSFRAGVMLQTNPRLGAQRRDFGEVTIYRLGVSHGGRRPVPTKVKIPAKTPTRVPTSTPRPAPTPSPPVPTSRPYYLTGYSYWDNTPPGSAAISHPVLHRQAGGAGTYDDPITVAVGHAIVNGVDIPLDAPGTRYYLQAHRRYLIVEDTCGDGPRPQDGPCYRLPAVLRGKAVAWLDAWMDGRAAGRTASDRCMSDLTGVTPVVKNPPRGLPVSPGPFC